MSDRREGATDPARSMALLWRRTEPPSRARSGPALSVDAIVTAAVTLADTDGLEAMTIRRVAERLSASPMALYTYVPARSVLLDLMLDQVSGETARPAIRPGRWRAALQGIAAENHALHLRHPWLLQVATGRPVLGPNVIAKYDYELGALDGLGLSDVEMDSMLTLLLSFVHGAARQAVDAVRVESQSGWTEQEWWDANAPYLAQVFDAARHPLAARVGAAAGEAQGAALDPARAFAYGLEVVLDGIAAHLPAARGSIGPPDAAH